MKKIAFALIALITIFFGACCSKKGACPTISFQSFQLINFTASEVSDSVVLYRYQANSGFSSPINTYYLKGNATNDPNVFSLTTDELSVNFDYEIKVVKLGKSYRIDNFTGEKIACGKCFLRSNNQFGYKLNGYSINNKHVAYDGIMQIVK
jgi:hypothetical protein